MLRILEEYTGGSSYYDSCYSDSSYSATAYNDI